MILWILTTYLLADAPVPTTTGLEGVGGWTGLGITGAILLWLLFRHLPAKDTQLETIINNHVSQIDKIHVACADERKTQSAQFREALNQILERSAKDGQANAAYLKEEIVELRQAVHELTKMVNTVGRVLARKERLYTKQQETDAEGLPQ